MTEQLTAKWLADEMERTGLGKAALAGTLGVHKSAISRLMAGTRRLSTSERTQAEAFFALVPKDASTKLVAAIRKLRSDRVRQRVGRPLLEVIRDRNVQHLLGVSDEVHGALAHALVDAIARREDIWRADQILVLCDELGIDLIELVDRNRCRITRDVRTFAASRATTALSSEYPTLAARIQGTTVSSIAAESVGVAAATSPYDQRKKSSDELPDPGPRWSTAFRSIPPPFDILQRCVCFEIDDSLVPDLERGDIIFVDCDRSPRPGEPAVVLRHQGGGEVAIGGRLVDEDTEWFTFLHRGTTLKITHDESIRLARIQWYLRRT